MGVGGRNNLKMLARWQCIDRCPSQRRYSLVQQSAGNDIDDLKVAYQSAYSVPNITWVIWESQPVNMGFIVYKGIFREEGSYGRGLRG